MTPLGHSQRAGDDSTQYQAARDVIVVTGVTEQRVREIMHEFAKEVQEQHLAVSAGLIEARVSELDDRVMAELAAHDRLDAFADPAFVRAYRKAVNGAAATERPADYDTLTALLTKRCETAGERQATSSIDRAIEIVDQVDDTALRALTVFRGVGNYIPASGLVTDGLNALEGLYADLLDGSLPIGEEWIDHLDILDAVRIASGVTLMTMPDIFARDLSGYVVPGAVAAHVPEFVSEKLPGLRWDGLLIDHELKPGYKRVGHVSEASWRQALQKGGLSDDFIDVLVDEAAGLTGLRQVDGDALDELMRRVHERPSLSRVTDWWGTIRTAFAPTAIGRMLADANAYRLDTAHRLPPRTPENTPTDPSTR